MVALSHVRNAIPTDAAPVQIDMRNEYDQVIQETEAAYSRLLESSRSLLTVLERETLNIHRDKKTSEQAEAMVLV
jgi:sjoegren syndrome nuclear autoantigen 1